MADYLLNGAMMVNEITFCDGNKLPNVIGGGAVYAAAGAGLWSDQVMLSAGCGRDKEEIFGPWLRACGIGQDAVLMKGNKTNRFFLRYHADGSYEEGLLGENETQWDKIDFMTSTPEEMEQFCRGIKGMYNIMDVDPDYWRKLFAIKEKYRFQIMWEVATATADQAHLQQFKEILNYVDYYSLNFKEAKALFGLETEEQVIDYMKSLNKPVYFRVGVKGAYVIREGKVCFMPSYITPEEVDPTGCGNSSTAAAMVGFVEGKNAWEIGAMGAVTASYNARQYGPTPVMNETIRGTARQLVDELVSELINFHSF